MKRFTAPLRSRRRSAFARAGNATIVGLASLLAGCGGGGDGSGALDPSDLDGDPGGGLVPPSDGGSGGSPAASFAGLYDITQSTDGLTDVGYIEFTADSRVVLYDYQQDDVGSGRNCHVVRTSGPVTALGNDTYLLGTGADAQEVIITRSDAGLLITEQQFMTINGFPQFVPVTDEATRIDAFTSTDLPLCR